MPVVVMVIMLRDIVEDRDILAVRGDDDFLDRLAVELRSLDEIVGVGHIGGVMFIVMIFKGFL
jgi:hypothetical protein